MRRPPRLALASPMPSTAGDSSTRARATQLLDANRRSEMHGLSADERKKAKQQQAQANEQLALLERGGATAGSDFYTYRYLATEGFLPGYNFPRLPLYAYVPSTTAGTRGAYLQRARFIAISEFGPRSLIYHEGRAYRVYKAKLPPEVRTEEGGRLATKHVLYLRRMRGCSRQEEARTLPRLRRPMGGVHPVRNVLRIDNVETSAGRAHHRQRRGPSAPGFRHSDGVRLARSATVGLDVTRRRCEDADG